MTLKVESQWRASLLLEAWGVQQEKLLLQINKVCEGMGWQGQRNGDSIRAIGRTKAKLPKNQYCWLL
ncbi:hypothetical protein OOJ96_20095 [Pseudomonas sp. 15FMM2]|uniref:Uncharacterized protein n=1 Tax=Pseudomonas imrae TaxID=2992837 RepID=A0ACC7PLZ7_9PSED